MSEPADDQLSRKHNIFGHLHFIGSQTYRHNFCRSLLFIRLQRDVPILGRSHTSKRKRDDVMMMVVLSKTVIIVTIVTFYVGHACHGGKNATVLVSMQITPFTASRFGCMIYGIATLARYVLNFKVICSANKSSRCNSLSHLCETKYDIGTVK